jgi:hypothetical protein
MRLLPVALLAAGAACGRIGIDPREDAAPMTPPAEAAVPACPPETTEIEPGASTCIELVERSTLSWVDAGAKCQALARRLCTDDEWATACNRAAGLVDMIDDENGTAANWEWTGDLTPGGEGKKRGLATCDDQSSHPIDTDPYDFRCCAPKS